jgi:hypothetical protein
MNLRRGLIVLGVIAVAALLAFPLREVANAVILLPLAYLLWLLNLLYLSLDQAFWWIALAVVLLFILGASLLPEFKPSKKMISYHRNEHGRVEAFAQALRKSSNGIYFKWLVANRLGKLAFQLLTQRDHGKPRSVFAPLTGEGWDAPPETQAYLEKGLRGSFADFPNAHWNSFAPPVKTALDHDVQAVVAFLESKIETDK